MLLPERYQRTLEALLAEHVAEAEVWAYGSRVDGSAHDGSDLDIVLRNFEDLDQPVPGRSELLEAIEASDIPILMDVGDWALLPAWLRKSIASEYVVLRNAEIAAIHHTDD